MLENALFCRQNARLKNSLFCSTFCRQNLSYLPYYPIFFYPIKPICGRYVAVDQFREDQRCPPFFCIIAGHIQLMKLYYKSTSWASYDLPKALKKRGVDEVNKLPNFHYREDALKLWTAIEEFLIEILFIYYRSDDDIKKVRGA